MLIRDGENLLKLTATHRSNTVYDAGNTQFAIRIHITDQKTIFAAETGCWIELRMLVAFAEQLCALEEQRQGSAALQSMSPDEFQLEIRSIDPIGHMAAVGQVGHWFHTGSGDPYWSDVKFRVPFCPSELPTLVREFRALAVTPMPNHTLNQSKT